MILLLFLYDPLYASSHDLESDYPWSGLKDDNSPTPDLICYLTGFFSAILPFFRLSRMAGERQKYPDDPVNPF